MIDHACSTHARYGLTCDDLAELKARAGGKCERCFQSFERLDIDHDHALGLHAVRGLLCSSCNSRLGWAEGERGFISEMDRAYLANPWHGGRRPFVADRSTPLRGVRVDDALWNSAKSIARDRRTTVTWVMKRALVEYVERYEQEGDR